MASKADAKVRSFYVPCKSFEDFFNVFGENGDCFDVNQEEEWREHLIIL